MKKGDGRVSYSVHPSPILGDGRMDALKDGRGWTGDGRTMDGEMDIARPNALVELAEELRAIFLTAGEIRRLGMVEFSARSWQHSR
jgi:hypothetical protein